MKRIRFAVIGANHAHIYGLIAAAERGGGELVAFSVREPAIAAEFARRCPNAKHASDERAILEDPSIELVLSSAVPSERASLGIRVMQRGGLGPHRVHPPERPHWFWDPAKHGGIICDIGSHQVDQFLFFTGSTRAEVVAAQAQNVGHPEHPRFQDFGDVVLRGDGGLGYFRVDWFTPAALPAWGTRANGDRERRLHRDSEEYRSRGARWGQSPLHRERSWRPL